MLITELQFHRVTGSCLALSNSFSIEYLEVKSLCNLATGIHQLDNQLHVRGAQIRSLHWGSTAPATTLHPLSPSLPNVSHREQAAQLAPATEVVKGDGRFAPSRATVLTLMNETAATTPHRQVLAG